MFTLKAYSPAQLRKMNTERLHRLYEQVTGRTMFNPYTAREDMVIEILGRIERIVYAACFQAEAVADVLNPLKWIRALRAQRERMAAEARRKITDFQVRLIRAARRAGVKLSEIVALFADVFDLDVSVVYVSDVANRLKFDDVE